MLIKREKMINTFKVLSIVLLTYMILSFYSAIANEVPNSKFKNTEYDYSFNIKKLKNSFFVFPERLQICEQITNEKLDPYFLMNRSVYYSFAIFLGAFINAKRIMIIGVL